jgi:hypothetical protein
MNFVVSPLPAYHTMLMLSAALFVAQSDHKYLVRGDGSRPLANMNSIITKACHTLIPILTYHAWKFTNGNPLWKKENIRAHWIFGKESMTAFDLKGCGSSSKASKWD